jgi:hypothetical protein
LDNPLFGQQHHAFSVLGIDARSPANRSVITAKAVGVAKLIAARNAEKRHINRQLAALNQLYATAVEWICTGFSIRPAEISRPACRADRRCRSGGSRHF